MTRARIWAGAFSRRAAAQLFILHRGHFNVNVDTVQQRPFATRVVSTLRARRMAPDLFFHDQIYRHSGEIVLLPPGKYTVTCPRGPEYRILSRRSMSPTPPRIVKSFSCSGGSSWPITAGTLAIITCTAGCAHYESPEEGVQPEDMMRHIQGEDLNIGCVLSWGPCWYFQKQYFEGKVAHSPRPRT